MTLSARFVLDAVLCAGLAIVLWCACAGIGFLVLPRRSATDEPGTGTTPSSWRRAGMAAPVGLGVLMAFGGVAVLLRLPWWLVVVPFLVAGLALAIRDAWRSWRPEGGVTGRGALFGGAMVVAVGAVALVEAPAGLRFLLNACDDYRAYMPMAHRILDTYGMEAAWSTRRLQSLGGVDLLRALSLSVLGDRAVGMVDTVVASVFLAGLLIGNGVRTTWARLLTLGLVLAIPFLFAPRVNTTGVLLAVPLLVAVLGATAALRAAARSHDRAGLIRWAVAGGLVTAALMSVRPNHGVLAAAILVAGSLIGRGLWWRAGVRAIVAAGATAFVTVLPWSLAMWRTAGSPLYPLFGGNLTQDATKYAPLHGFTDRFDRAWDLLQVGPYLWIPLVVILVALLMRRLLPDTALVVIAGLSTLAVAIAFALTMPYAGWSTFIRYIAPMSQGLAVFFLCEVIRGNDVPRPANAVSRTWVVPLASVGTAVVIVVIGFSMFRVPSWTYPYGVDLVAKGADDRLQPDGSVNPPLLERIYNRAMRLAGEDGTIVAVDRPYLIDHSRYDVPNMDLPGFLTPDGTEFPFFTGPNAKLAYLERAGYDTLVVTAPATDVCLAPATVERALEIRAVEGPRYVRYLDWGYDMESIEQGAPDAVRRVGNLWVIDLDRAERLMGTRGHRTDPRVERARAELRRTGPV